MRWKCVCAYDGTSFKGWQSQAGGGAIQDTIETALGRIFREEIRIHGSSRTDAGVHARGMVFHFDAEWEHGAERLRVALGTLLPWTIQISRISRVSEDFHARHSAAGKRYRYFIYQGRADPFRYPFCLSVARELSVSAMGETADILRGKRDFQSFCAYGGKEMETTVRDLRELSVKRRGREIAITAEADGFLYKMVRSLVGALVDVGTGKLRPEQVGEILEARERTALVVTAPPQGLFLEKVFY